MFLRQAEENGTSKMYDFSNFYPHHSEPTSMRKNSLEIITEGVEREEMKKVYEQMDAYAERIIRKYHSPFIRALAKKESHPILPAHARGSRIRRVKCRGR